MLYILPVSKPPKKMPTLTRLPVRPAAAAFLLRTRS